MCLRAPRYTVSWCVSDLLHEARTRHITLAVEQRNSSLGSCFLLPSAACAVLLAWHSDALLHLAGLQVGDSRHT